MKAAMRTLRTHLTYANVGVTICLIVVLGSATAVAAGRWGSADIVNNSLRSIDIRNNEVASADIKNNGVTSADVADGSLGAADITDDSLTAADLKSATRASFTDTSPWETIPSGVTVTGGFFEYYPAFGPLKIRVKTIQLPALPPATFAVEDVNFAADSNPLTMDDNLQCTGTVLNPTAPPGQICVYLGGGSNADDFRAYGFSDSQLRAMGLFYVAWRENAAVTAGDVVDPYGTWAYTAP